MKTYSSKKTEHLYDGESWRICQRRVLLNIYDSVLFVTWILKAILDGSVSVQGLDNHSNLKKHP